jgi:uncharacterized protein with ACT and thioredoxin-like domain
MSDIITTTRQVHQIISTILPDMVFTESKHNIFEVKFEVGGMYLSIAISINEGGRVIPKTTLMQEKNGKLDIIYIESVGYDNVKELKYMLDIVDEIKDLKKFFSSSDFDEEKIRR